MKAQQLALNKALLAHAFHWGRCWTKHSDNIQIIRALLIVVLKAFLEDHTLVLTVEFHCFYRLFQATLAWFINISLCFRQTFFVFIDIHGTAFGLGIGFPFALRALFNKLKRWAAVMRPACWLEEAPSYSDTIPARAGDRHIQHTWAVNGCRILKPALQPH